MSMLKSMLGFDPAEVKQYIEQLAHAAEGMHKEQQRLAQFQNLLAESMIQARRQIDEIHAAYREHFAWEAEITRKINMLRIDKPVAPSLAVNEYGQVQVTAHTVGHEDMTNAD
jgi:hypothetical protein